MLCSFIAQCIIKTSEFSQKCRRQQFNHKMTMWAIIDRQRLHWCTQNWFQEQQTILNHERPAQGDNKSRSERWCKNTPWKCGTPVKRGILSTFPTDTTCQLNILGHDSHTLSMNSAQIGVLKQPHQVRFWSLLESEDSRALEPKVRLEVLCYLTHKPLKRQLPDQKLSRLLVFPDLTKSNSSRPISMRLLHTTSRRRRLPGRLSC